MDIKTKVQDIIEGLKLMADKDRKEWSNGYFPTKLEVLGVTVPGMRILTKELIKDLKPEPVETTLNLSKALVKTEIFECQQVGYEIIEKNKKAKAALTLDDLYELEGIQDNWVSVDTFCGYLAGPAWREGQIPENIIYDWAKSEDLWKRRSALVCTVTLNQKARGGKGDIKRTIRVCEILKDDKTDMVVKALSWALRELSKFDKKPVQEFLEKYSIIMSKRAVREVKRKLETGLKN